MALEILLYILIFIGSCLVLVKAGAWSVKTLIRIAQFLRWKEFFVSFILMAFATSLPELFVGISSALHGVPEISLGDIIGSNVINLTLVIGIAAILAKGLRLKSVVAKRDSLYTAFIAILPVIALLDGVISRADAVILILVTVFYFQQVFSQKEAFTKIFKDTFERRTAKLWRRFFLDILLFAGSIFLLLFSAEGIIRSVVYFANFVDVPLFFIGIVFVSLGTNLPELTFGVKSVMMGRKQMVLGNVMGSVVVNSSLVIGTVALIHPIRVTNFSPFIIGIAFTFLAAISFYFFARQENQISTKEGKILIAIYVIFILFEIIGQF
jgi:cation:H+ antiporter